MSEPTAYSLVRRFGVIVPSVNTVLERELYGLGLEDVSFHFARVRSERGSDEAILRRMADDAPAAAALLADARPERIVYACTSGSLVGGPGFDRELGARIFDRTGIPATTTATQVLESFRCLGVSSVAVGTPYLDWVTRAEADFFEAAGYSVTSTTSLGLVDGQAMAALAERDVAELAMTVDRAEADAVFLSCTDLPTLRAIARLEGELGKPVVSSNLATVRGLLGGDPRLWGLARLCAASAEGSQ